MTETETVEQEIQRKGLTAPRVRPQDIEDNIAGEYFFTAREGVLGATPLDTSVDRFLSCPVPADEYQDGKRGEQTGTNLLSASGAREMFANVLHRPTPAPLGLLTFCVLVLKNGFTVTGESACASPENFDAELGKRIARQNAVSKVWPLMGYALRERLAS